MARKARPASSKDASASTSEPPAGPEREGPELPERGAHDAPEASDGSERLVEGIDELDNEVEDAVISLNRLNLTNPPLPLKFGTWNDRPVVMPNVQKLCLIMKSQNFRPFRSSNRIPLVCKLSDLDPSCITPSITQIHKAPFLKISESGRSRGVLKAAGGNHRFHAVNQAINEAQKELEQLKESLVDEERRRVTTAEDIAKRDEDVASLKEEIKRKETFCKSIAIWGVVVYDEGKCSD